jgi:hypothetical protein
MPASYRRDGYRFRVPDWLDVADQRWFILLANAALCQPLPSARPRES